MSVVAAKVYKDKILIAADSQITMYWDYRERKGDFQKLVRVNDMIIGASGVVAEAGLFFVYARTHSPDAATEKDVLTFVTEFGKWKKDYSPDSTIANQYLVALDGELFLIDGGYPIKQNSFASIGYGFIYANTAMHLGKTPSEAVKVTCELCSYVGEPVVEMEMPRKQG